MAYSKIPREDLEIEEQIGTGGFSSVFKAKWKSKDVHVAAKRLNKPDRNEIEILSGLDHPNIVNLLGVIDEKWEFFLILELCEEGSLRSYLDKHRGEKLKQFYDWAKQAGRPIQYLNKMKIVHKDVKSPNYLITKGNVLKLADFGSAKITDVTITATGTASYAWMAPELLAEEKLSPSYDIFAYMVVVWELWTTQIPFEGSCSANILYTVCEGDERPPIPSDMPKPLADLMRQSWDKDWSKRPSIDHILSVLIFLETEAERIATQKRQQCIAGPWKSVNEFGHHDGPGKLHNARGIAVNPTTDEIAVADAGSRCVKVYSNEGEYRFSLDTTQGMTPGIGSYPWNVTASAEGNYYVTDSTQHVKVYTGEGVYKCKWVAISHEDRPSDTGHTALRGLTMAENGQLLVGQVCDPPYVSKHHQDGSHIASIKMHIKPYLLATTLQDTIIIGDNMQKVVQIVNNTGNVSHSIHHSRNVSFWSPCGIYCYQDIVFISNTDYIKNHEIAHFSVHGEYIGTMPLQKWPRCIILTKDGHELLTACEDRVQIYAKSNVTDIQHCMMNIRDTGFLFQCHPRLGYGQISSGH